uniref:Uncharacterized protein n=1 Tax=Steinernema glaseri TaxID=37863 RepID=A0A1I7ZWX8_9BILA
MDRVPICFIEEVLLQISYKLCGPTSHGEHHKLPCIWGRIAKRKPVKETVGLHLCFVSEKEAHWNVWRHKTSESVPLANLGHFTISHIVIWGRSMEGYRRCDLLTETNFKVLRKYLRTGLSCIIIFSAKKRCDHPLVRKLCLAPTRVTRIELFKPTPIQLEILTQSVTRGTLRSFEFPFHLNVTNELLHVLLEFVASVQIEEFSLYVALKSPISYETVLSRVAEAFLSRERAQRFKFYARCGSKHI